MEKLKFKGIILSIFCIFSAYASYAADKFDVLPDLPESLVNAAQASSVSTIETSNEAVAQTVGKEPSFLSMLFSLAFVIILIYAVAILYKKLNKFGVDTLKMHAGSDSVSRVSVISTTALGANKTLHVVELDGKRMLLGASANSIDLIKDLGAYPPSEVEEGEYSKIEIPNIRIPKIEIPRIEIPGFTKVISKTKEREEKSFEKPQKNSKAEDVENDKFEISDIYEEENPDGIIDKLFHTATVETKETVKPEENEHKVDPDEYALYKKYL